MELLIFLITGVIIVLMVTKTSYKNKGKQHRRIDIMNQNKIYDYLKEYELNDCKKFISKNFSNGIVLDEHRNELLFITKKFTKKDGLYEFDFKKIKTSDLLESEIVVDNQTLYKTVRSNQLVGMAVGSLLGTAGMVIGGLSGSKIKHEKVKSVDLKLLVNNIEFPTYKISFLSNVDSITGQVNVNGFSKDSNEVRVALNHIEKWYGIIEVLIKQQNKELTS